MVGKRKCTKLKTSPTTGRGLNTAAKANESYTISQAIFQIKTEPPEFVPVIENANVTEVEPSAAVHIVKEEPLEPIDTLQTFAFINEERFDEHTTNPIRTTIETNNTANSSTNGSKALTCGRISIEVSSPGGSRTYNLICSYCGKMFRTCNDSFWQSFTNHINDTHATEVQPRRSSAEVLVATLCESMLNAEASDKVGDDKIKPIIGAPATATAGASATVNKMAVTNENLRTDVGNDDDDVDDDDDEVGVDDVADNIADVRDFIDDSEQDETDSEDDESYGPKSKRVKKAAGNAGKYKNLQATKNKKVDDILSFDYPNKECVICFLELLKSHAILWHPRQSIMKRFDEALTEVTNEFNKSCPEHTKTKEQLRLSINRVKDLYNRVSNETQKRRMKTSMYKMNYPEYLSLCAEIETNSKNIMETCEVCQTVFYNGIDLQIHKVKKHRIGELPFKCERCGYGFTCPVKLADHEKKHNRVRTFTCEICFQSFYFENKLQAHMTLHTDDSKQICEICGKKFPSLSKYRRHKLHHEAPKEKCEICGKLYFEKWTLSEHMKSHRNERQYKCDICGKTFNRQEGVTIHKRGVHKVKTQPKKYEYVWVDKSAASSAITPSSNTESDLPKYELADGDANNTNSNSSSFSAATNEQAMSETKPQLLNNQNPSMIPLEILNTLLN